jgi:hypothetical protein
MEYDIGKLDEYDRLRSGINACIGGNESGQEARRKHVLMLAVELAQAAFGVGFMADDVDIEPAEPPPGDDNVYGSTSSDDPFAQTAASIERGAFSAPREEPDA